MKNKFIILAALLLAMIFAFSGCLKDTAEETQTAGAFPADAQMTITGQTSEDTADLDTETNADEDLAEITGGASKKDLDADYDEKDAVIISLSDTGSGIDGDGASASGGTVTIKNAGTYIISGKLSNGQIVVDTTKVDTVQMVLSGVDITNKSGSAIYVKQAEKVIITLADGSDNYVTDAKEYEDTSDGAPDAAIYAGDDLTINGNGSLTVDGGYKHSIKTVDDLVVAGGALSLTSEQESLRGKDSVTITGGSISIMAGGDAIKSDNSEDENSGWILIEGGSFDIEAGNSGIEAATALEITGGTFGIDSGQDALHSNGSIRISAGVLSLSADDDGVHADNSLDITGGEITVLQSYEGLEASDITVRGGRISVSARDDGINAAGGSDGDAMPGDRFRQSGNYFVSISGGYTYIDADGDGVDSNGDIEISGGTLIVDGPESGGNSAMDMEMGTYEVSGGTLAAAGSLQMLVTPTNAPQPTVTIIFDSVQQAGTTLAIADTDGGIIAVISPQKAYQCITISSPSFASGGTYKLLLGGKAAGESFDGTYYSQGTYENAADTAEFVFSSTSIIIGPDGGQAQYSGGMPGGMPGGGGMPGRDHGGRGGGGAQPPGGP